MLTLNKTSNKELIIKSDTSEIKTLFINNKIWLNKKEISKLFGTEKSEVKKTLKLIKNESNFNKEENITKKYNKQKRKYESFYSLEYIISVGYRLKSYNETKFLINSNNILKEYNQKRGSNNGRVINGTPFLSKIFQYFNRELELKH